MLENRCDRLRQIYEINQKTFRTVIMFPPRAKPTLEWHNSVVVHVKEGKVGELLLQHEKEGVEHVKELGDVEDPGKVERSDGLWIV